LIDENNKLRQELETTQLLKIDYDVLSRENKELREVFGLGLAIFFMAQLVINIGMNIGLLPVTGITVPFMSYGGSHLIVEFAGLGILSGMARYSRPVHKGMVQNEIIGV